MVRPVLSALYVSAIALFAWVPCAPAAVVGVSGAGDILFPTGNPLHGTNNTGATANFFNNTGAGVQIHAWNEQQSVTLLNDITVDIADPGTYQKPFASADAVIGAGTRISSHLLFLDPLGHASRTATFTFDQDILGIIVLSDLSSAEGGDHLLATDFLGNSHTQYPTEHFRHRGVEFQNEILTLGSNLRELTVNLTASTPGDQIRVITAAAMMPVPVVVVPTPSGLAGGAGLLVGVGVVKLRRRMRRGRREC